MSFDFFPVCERTVDAAGWIGPRVLPFLAAIWMCLAAGCKAVVQ